MAIYHMKTKVVKRSEGRSAVAAASYRSGQELRDRSTERTHDYPRSGEDVSSWIEAPENAPEWVSDREELWNRVEEAETRRDSQVAREVQVGIPKELDRERQEELVSSYVREQFVERGMVADVNLHRADENNPHAHIMLSTREISEEGFGNKNREGNKTEERGRWREGWEQAANRELERAGIRAGTAEYEAYAQRIRDAIVGKEAIEASIDGMSLVDPQGHLLYMNQAHARINGYDRPDELLGQHWSVFYDEAERQRFERTIMPALAKRGQWRGEASGRVGRRCAASVSCGAQASDGAGRGRRGGSSCASGSCGRGRVHGCGRRGACRRGDGSRSACDGVG